MRWYFYLLTASTKGLIVLLIWAFVMKGLQPNTIVFGMLAALQALEIYVLSALGGVAMPTEVMTMFAGMLSSFHAPLRRSGTQRTRRAREEALTSKPRE
jgi:hypothetical protein